MLLLCARVCPYFHVDYSFCSPNFAYYHNNSMSAVWWIAMLLLDWFFFVIFSISIDSLFKKNNNSASQFLFFSILLAKSSMQTSVSCWWVWCQPNHSAMAHNLNWFVQYKVQHFSKNEKTRNVCQQIITDILLSYRFSKIISIIPFSRGIVYMTLYAYIVKSFWRRWFN